MIADDRLAPLAIAVSVLLHVSWNLIARHQPRESEPMWWVLAGHLVLLAPWGLWRLANDAIWSGTLVALLVTSALANAFYFGWVQNAYRYAPVAFVYPLVRSSPLLIAITGAALGEVLPTWAWAGVMLSVLGLAWLASTGRGAEEIRALPWALAAMVGTTVYSHTDKAATVSLPGFGALLGYVSVGAAAGWVLLTVRIWRATGRWRPPSRPGNGALLVGSMSVGVAYALVIHAMRAMPAAEVVAYTNAGIVLATLASIAVFRERRRWAQRLGASGIICVGLAVLALGRRAAV